MMATRYILTFSLIFLCIIKQHCATEEETDAAITDDPTMVTSVDITTPFTENNDAIVQTPQNVTQNVLYVYPSVGTGKPSTFYADIYSDRQEKSASPLLIVFPTKGEEWNSQDVESDTRGNTIESSDKGFARNSYNKYSNISVSTRFTISRKPSATSTVTFENTIPRNNKEGDIIVGKRIAAVDAPSVPRPFTSNEGQVHSKIPSRTSKPIDAQNAKKTDENIVKLRERLSQLSNMRSKVKVVKRLTEEQSEFGTRTVNRTRTRRIKTTPRPAPLNAVIQRNTRKPAIEIINNDYAGVDLHKKQNIKTKDNNLFESIKINTAIKVAKTHSAYKDKENKKEKIEHIMGEDNVPMHTKFINLKVITKEDDENRTTDFFKHVQDMDFENTTGASLENVRMIPFTLDDAVTPSYNISESERPKRNFLWDFLGHGNKQQYPLMYAYGKPYQKYYQTETWPAVEPKKYDISQIQKLPSDISKVSIVGDIPKPLTPVYRKDEAYRNQLPLPKI